MRLRLLLIMLFACSQWAFAQRYSFLQRGVEDGLPNAVINDLLEDQTGMIWLATDGGGLVRFDGTSFTTPDVFKSLPSPFITVLEKDKNGSFWIGTERGLAFYDGLSLTLFGQGPKERINAISIADDAVWIATRQGLFAYAEGDFTAYKNLQNQDVLGVAQWAGNLFYCTNSGAFKVENAEETHLDFGSVSKIISLKDGLLFCAAQNAVCQLADTVFNIAVPGIRDAALTENGTLWLASQRNGLIRLRNGKTEIIDAKHGLAYDRVRSVLYKNGKLWIGSQQGLAFFQNPESFVIDASQGILDESVHAALKLGDDFWLGTASGVSVFYADGKVESFGAGSGLPNGIALDFELFEGKIWVATEQGVAFFNNRKFTKLAGNTDFTFCLKNTGSALIIGTANGALRYKGGKLETIPFLDSIPDGIVDVNFTHQGEAFLGLSGAVYAPTAKGLKRVEAWKELPIDTLHIFAIKSSPKQECLLVNGVGIFLWNGNRIIRINESNGLASTLFKSAEFVGERLWVITDRGMQFVEATTDAKNPFRIGGISKLSFINQRDFNSRALHISVDKKLLCGSNNGLFVVDDASIAMQNKLAVSILDVNLFFKSGTNWAEFTNLLAPWSNLPQKLALPFDQNYLSFKFDVPPFNAYDAKIYLRFKLLGQDKKWTYVDERREAFFTNIRPGKYTFLVESSLTPNFLEVEKATFSFKIIPPFWRTWWFWTLVILAVIGLTILFVRYRLHQLNQKLALETALADSERKALRLQMNPHFVFNALDAISGFIFKNEPKEAVRYLGSFAKLMRITLESSRESVVPLHNEIQLLKNYIDLEQLRFNNKFAYTITVDDAVDVYDAHVPPMLLQPFVENAILHGLRHKEGDEGLLEISFEDVDNHLVCSIKDNGIGREKSAELGVNSTKKSLATSITKERIELLSKSLGERVTFSIIDLKTASGEAAGTKVTITFPHLEAAD